MSISKLAWYVLSSRSSCGSNNAFQPSRVAADFSVEIFDWNQIEAAKSIGVAKIELSDVEPFQAVERSLKLVINKLGEKGQIRVRLVFQPEIIAKSRKNTSTFTSAGRAMTQIGGLPVDAGKGVLRGVAGVFKRGDRDHAEVSTIPDVHSGQASQPVGISEHLETISTPFPSTPPNEVATNEPGALKVTVLDAKDFNAGEIKPYVVLRLGDKEFKTKHTSKTATPEWYAFSTRKSEGHTTK
jgi:Ca2+-dependent lipid-binding protein